MGLEPNCYQIGSKTFFMHQTLGKFSVEKRISMLAGLSCKFVFFRPEHNAKGAPPGIKF